MEDVDELEDVLVLHVAGGQGGRLRKGEVGNSTDLEKGPKIIITEKDFKFQAYITYCSETSVGVVQVLT